MADVIHPLPARQSAAAFHHAKVLGGDSAHFMLQGSQGVFAARCAVSCLVVPVAGDQVLVSSSDNVHYILAVLTHDASAAAELRLPPKTQIKCSEHLEIQGTQIGIQSADLNLTSVRSHWISGALKLYANRLDAQHEEVNFRAGTVQSLMQRVVQRADTVMRWVEGVETANIGQCIKTVREAWTLHAKHAVLTARSDVRIDGERIHMG
ncbi:Hypothetical protein HDN1F_12260 [gamma proteobacterium HdN1]|nr:Hypothetical protein HDN1F_12260 [gamma proteobacterium HdN1]